MQRKRYTTAADYNAGAYAATYLDTAVNVSQYNHPAVAAGGVTITSTSTVQGQQLVTGSGLPADVLSLSRTPGGNLWAALNLYAVTTEAGDGVSFSTTARQVSVRLAGILAAGVPGLVSGGSGLVANAIRNGVVATISVDGAVQATLDTYGGRPSAVLTLDGARHTILITHTGGYNPAVQPISAVQALVGTSVSAGLSVNALYHPTFVQASWRVLATGAATYSLYKTPPGGAETLVAAGLVTGTTYATSAYVPGVSMVLTGTLTTNDSATFTTDVTMLAVESVLLGYGTAGTGAGTAYTSAILDGGASDTQWFLAEWQHNAPMLSFVLRTGNTPAVDVSWSTYTVTPSDVTLPVSTARMGFAGLQAAARGRYAQWQIVYPTAAAVTPYIRDVALYYWTPERDPHFIVKLGLPRRGVPGPLMTAFCGSLAAAQACTDQRVADFIAGLALSGAVDEYLAGYGVDLAVKWFTGEDQTTYRSRLLAAFQNHADAGSLATIQRLVAAFTGFATSQVGVSTLGAAYQWQLVVPAPVAGPNGAYYPGLPGLTVAQAQTIIAQYVKTILNPITSVITPLNSSSNIVFN